MTSFNKYKEDYIRFRAVINLAAKKEESSDNDSSNEENEPATKKVAEKKGSKHAAFATGIGLRCRSPWSQFKFN